MKKILAMLLFAMFIVVSVPGSVQGAVGGFTKADIISNYQDLSGSIWLIQWTQTGFDTDKLAFSLTPDDLYSLSSGKFKSETGFTLSVDAFNDGCFYDISKSSKPRIYTVDAIQKEFWKTDGTGQQAWISANCINGLAYVATAVPNILANHVWCAAISTEIGTMGEIGSPQYEFETQWAISAQGKPTLTANICSGVHTSNACSGINAKLGNYAWVVWQGNLMSGKTCQVPTNVLAVHSNTFSNGWRVTNSQAYQTWLSYAGTPSTGAGLWIDIKNWAEGHVTESQVESNSNNLAYAAISPDSDSPFVRQWTNSVPVIENPSIDSGVIRFATTDKRLIFPTFNLYVDGNYYIKLIKPTGKPSITGVSIGTVNEGLSENAIISVKNIGTNTGGFNIRISSCSQYFIPSTNDVGVTLGPSSSTTVPIPIEFAYTGKEPTISGTCVAEMKETTTGETVTKTFSVTGKQMLECTPGQRGCSGNDVKVCNAEGSAYDVVETCTGNQKCENGQCVSVSEPCTVPGTQRCRGIVIDTCSLTFTWTTTGDCNDNNAATTDSCVASAIPGRVDCSHQAGGGFDPVLIILALIPVLGAAAAWAVKKERIWAVIGGVAGVMVAVILYIIYVFILQNWLILLLGAVLGGVAFYLLGGFAFVAMLIIYLITRK
jgi:hypothetical protein